MTSSKRAKVTIPPDPSPTPMPIAGMAEDEGKKKVKKRRHAGGRESTILAGKMMSKNGGILNVTLG